jgi:hypothetical protein
MIETLFARASSLARLLEPPLGSYLESLASTNTPRPKLQS